VGPGKSKGGSKCPVLKQKEKGNDRTKSKEKEAEGMCESRSQMVVKIPF